MNGLIRGIFMGMLATVNIQAAVITVSNWDGNNVGAWGNWTISATNSGSDILYSWSRTGDLDGGTLEDIFSFDLRLKAWTESSYAVQDMILGTAYNLGADYSGTNSPNQHFGPGGDLDNNQSLQLSVENINFTQGEGLGWTASFDGFSAISKYGGNSSYYVGTTGAEAFLSQGNGNLGFTGPLDVLTITSIGVNNSRFRDLDFSFMMASPERPSTASSFWFMQTAGTEDLVLNNGRNLTNLNDMELSCASISENGQLIYSVTWSGNDLNDDGSADTLSFDLLVEGFTHSTYVYSTNANQSSMTALGESADAIEVDNTWGVFDDDVDAGESLRFSVTNLQVSVVDYTAVFEGFTGFEVEEAGGRGHRLIIGEGIGLEGKEFDAPTAQYTFPAVDQFVVTGAGSFYDHLQWAVSEIYFKISIVNPAGSNVWNVTDYSDYVVGPLMADEYPAQASTSNFPSFSWDTVPQWLIVRKKSAYTDDEIRSMAMNYNLIVWEKANAAGFNSIEEGILDTATRIRAVEPATKNIFYLNSYIHYFGYAANAAYESYEWEWSNHTTDTNGNEVLYYHKDLYLTHNYAVADLRDWWVNTQVGMATYDVIDGVFIDKVVQSIPSIYDDYGEPISDYAAMLDQLNQALPEGKLCLGNTLRNERNYAGRAYMEVQDGSYFERWSLPNGAAIPAQSEAEAVAVTLQLLREGVSKGKIMLLKSVGSTASEEAFADGIDYALALFLIAAETNAYFAYQSTVDATDDQWKWDGHWVPELNYPLGAPLGDPIKNGFIYTRSYEHVDVWVDLETKETVLAWDSEDSDGDGLDDLWEFRNFGDETIADPEGDPDGDGLTNMEEYIVGTNPNLPSSFEISDLILDQSLQLEWDAVDGRLYQVYWSSNLVDGFALIGSNLVDGLFIDTTADREVQGFYKITVEREP
ncbi:MAG: putative glycoside hydrolase [Pontiella sp.]